MHVFSINSIAKMHFLLINSIAKMHNFDYNIVKGSAIICLKEKRWIN